jgi:hypothetical protein
MRQTPVHLDEEQIQRLLHGELTPSSAASARDHVAGCPECSSRLAEVEREEAWVLDRLRALDHPPPPMSAKATMIDRRGVAWVRWAAGILLAIGLATVAYAAPGSPLRRLVHRVSEWIAGGQPSAPRGYPATVADSAARGIAVTPGNRFTIVFSTEQPRGTATVLLTGGTEVVVRAVGGAATFTSDLDRLSVDNSGNAARFEVEIPHRAPYVEIRVGDRRAFAKDGSRIVSDGRRESEDRYVLPLSRAPR